MKRTDIIALLVVLSIGVLVCTYMFVIKDARDDIDNLDVQKTQLEAEVRDLEAKEAMRAQYEEETEQFRAEFQEELKKYPADLNQETTVMWMKGVEQNCNIQNMSFTMPRDTEYWRLGSTYSTANDVQVNGASNADAQYVAITDAYAVNYQGSYENLKNYLNYVAEYKYRMNISSITINYAKDEKNPEGMCSGSVILNAYAVSGPDRTPDKVSVDVEEGVDNIFEGKGGLPVASAYDADGGQAIVANHNIIILLNNAGNDTTSGIIAATDENDTSTFVTSSANSVETMDLHIYAKDGKNYVSYAIGGKSYEKEVLTSDVTVYVSSSARVDADDANGVKVNVNNETPLSVYFKVVGDDTTSPRFAIGNRTGTIKQY